MKDAAVLIRLSKAERARLIAEANAADQPLSWYIRRKLFAGKSKGGKQKR